MHYAFENFGSAYRKHAPGGVISYLRAWHNLDPPAAAYLSLSLSRSIHAVFHGYDERLARGNCTVARSLRIPQGVPANLSVQCVGTAAAAISLKRRRWSSCTLIFFGFSILIFLKWLLLNGFRSHEMYIVLYVGSSGDCRQSYILYSAVRWFMRIFCVSLFACKRLMI